MGSSRQTTDPLFMERKYNMKNMTIAAATAAILSTSAAYANELAVVGGFEYATEAETVEVTAGVEYATNGFTITPLLTADDAAGDFEFTSAEITVGYAVAPQVELYTTVETDADWEHDETTLGVAFRF